MAEGASLARLAGELRGRLCIGRSGCQRYRERRGGKGAAPDARTANTGGETGLSIMMSSRWLDAASSDAMTTRPRARAGARSHGRHFVARRGFVEIAAERRGFSAIAEKAGAVHSFARSKPAPITPTSNPTGGVAPAPRILVIGDVMTDIIVRPEGPLALGSDRRASITVQPGGSAANQAAWLASFGVSVDFIARVGAGESQSETARLKAIGVAPHLVGDPERETGRLVALVDATASAASSPTAAPMRRSRPTTSRTR